MPKIFTVSLTSLAAPGPQETGSGKEDQPPVEQASLRGPLDVCIQMSRVSYSCRSGAWGLAWKYKFGSPLHKWCLKLRHWRGRARSM